MKTLSGFIQDMNARIGIDVPKDWKGLSDIEVSRRFLSGVNEYFFQTNEDMGVTRFGKVLGSEEDLRYFSEFHKFWEAHHREILNARIDGKQARRAAICFSKGVRKYGRGILKVTTATHGLPPSAIAQVRFFTANQDFREPPQDQFQKYLSNPSAFEATEVLRDPEAFLRFLSVTKLSQTDKRLDFARNAAGFLLKLGIRAFGIARKFQNDAAKIRGALAEAHNMGYGLKKANMFIRDMVELRAWRSLKHYESVDVASDINTMKLALRTCVLRTDIPLLSSFLDIFGYQYSYIDEMSAAAWRRVWEEWRVVDPKTAPPAPCVLDFILYRIGREYCKDNLIRYTCERGHSFYHFGKALKLCRVCEGKGDRSLAKPGARMLPCQVYSRELPREEGALLLKESNLLRTFDGVCIFEDTCKPKTKSFRILDPPKSISVKGQTSWTNSMADRERGGGGMMG